MTVRYLLDRDVLSQLDRDEQDRHANVVSWLDAVPHHLLHFGAVTVMEG